MKHTVENLLNIAREELDYHEKRSNSQLDDKFANSGSNNYTKYARDLHNNNYYQASKQGYEWCDMFVDWCFLQLCGNKQEAEKMQCQTGPYGAGCEFSANYYKQQGRLFYSNPEPGDQIFLFNTSHTGIVEKVENGRVYTIEGNSNNKVERDNYRIGSSQISSYGRPFYENEDPKPIPPDPDPIPPTPEDCEIKSGDVVSVKNNAVWYNGGTVPSFVKNTKWKVYSVSGNRAVINESVDGKYKIMSPINVKYLTKDGCQEVEVIEVGDKVKMENGAYVYGTNYKFDSWVYNSTLYVRQLNGSRAVISTQPTGAITGAVDVKYLKKI